jgi:hypothetical protein
MVKRTAWSIAGRLPGNARHLALYASRIAELCDRERVLPRGIILLRTLDTDI